MSDVQYHQLTNVVTNQPVAMSTTTTTVVIQQPRGAVTWTSGLCGCCSDCKSCICSLLCGGFFYGCLAQRMGESYCVGCSGHSLGCVPGGHVAMRAHFRATHDIQGSICGDSHTATCCLPCMMCQLSREMDKRGYGPSDCCCC